MIIFCGCTFWFVSNLVGTQKTGFLMMWLMNGSIHALSHNVIGLSQRLIGELIGYPWSGVRPSSFTMLKNLLRNRFANQSQILCGASLGRGNNILFAASGSHDQDGHHAHIWEKPFKNLVGTQKTGFLMMWPIFTNLGM